MEDGRSARGQIPSSSVEHLRQELSSLQPRALHQRAQKEGVAQQTIDVFIDEELDKRTFLEIVIKRTLQNELSALKTRALHMRAKDAGVPQEVIDQHLEHLDEVIQKEAFIEIVIQRILLKEGTSVSTSEESLPGRADVRPSKMQFEHSELVHIMLATGLGGSALVTSLYSNWLWLALLIPAYAFFGLVGWFSFLGALTITKRKPPSQHQKNILRAAWGLSFFLVLLMPYMYTYAGKKIFFLVLPIPFMLQYVAVYGRRDAA